MKSIPIHLFTALMASAIFSYCGSTASGTGGEPLPGDPVGGSHSTDAPPPKPVIPLLDAATVGYPSWSGVLMDVDMGAVMGSGADIESSRKRLVRLLGSVWDVMETVGIDPWKDVDRVLAGVEWSEEQLRNQALPKLMSYLLVEGMSHDGMTAKMSKNLPTGWKSTPVSDFPGFAGPNGFRLLFCNGGAILFKGLDDASAIMLAKGSRSEAPPVLDASWKSLPDDSHIAVAMDPPEAALKQFRNMVFRDPNMRVVEDLYENGDTTIVSWAFQLLSVDMTPLELEQLTLGTDILSFGVTVGSDGNLRAIGRMKWNKSETNGLMVKLMKSQKRISGIPGMLDDPIIQFAINLAGYGPKVEKFGGMIRTGAKLVESLTYTPDGSEATITASCRMDDLSNLINQALLLAPPATG